MGGTVRGMTGGGFRRGLCCGWHKISGEAGSGRREGGKQAEKGDWKEEGMEIKEDEESGA